jgi:hypothetical protein
MKLDADEKELLDSVERGEWKSAGGKRERARYSRYAKATFRKDRRLNIRLSSKDLEAIQRGRSLRLQNKTAATIIVCCPRWKNLQGDQPIEPGIAGLPHLTHSAGSERSNELIGSDSGAGGDRHR